MDERLLDIANPLPGWTVRVRNGGSGGRRRGVSNMATEPRLRG